MYGTYGDWLLVIASYNCGPGNVNKALRKAGGKKTFWDIYPYLPKETQNYVPAFIAMTYLMNFHESYCIAPSTVNSNKTRLVQVECNSEYCYEVICSTLNITGAELRSFNPELRKTALPSVNKAFSLNLPYDKALLFWQLEDSIYQNSIKIKTWKAPVTEEPEFAKTNSNNSKLYKVKKGESLPAIAKKFDCKVWQLRAWNGLKSNKIYPGQKLKIRTS